MYEPPDATSVRLPCGARARCAIITGREMRGRVGKEIFYAGVRKTISAHNILRQSQTQT